MSQPELFHDLPLEEVIGDRFGRYSKYIIQDRALPDARDGLKPVQRRILLRINIRTHGKQLKQGPEFDVEKTPEIIEALSTFLLEHK